MIGEDFRHLPSVHDPDPAVTAARQARAARAKAQATAAQEKLEAQRARLAKADEILNELARVALSMNVDLDTRLKAANIYLDRVVPRQKSVEFTGDVSVQVDHRAYIAPADRVASMPFHMALEDYRRRMLGYDDQQRMAELGAVREGALIEGGHDDER